MRELVRTNDIVLVSAIGALLDGANIHHLVLDQNMSIIEGSLGVLPRRILVHEDDNRAGAPDSHRCRASPTNCGPMTESSGEFTEDAFLGGQLRLRQPKSGHRAGHDAMLLAAATPARPGDRVVDFGAGVGAAGLAVARRVAGIELVLVEIDATLAGLARGNAAANAIAADVIVLDVTSAAGAFAAAGLAPDSVDVVLMNPPFNDPARHRASPDKARDRACRRPLRRSRAGFTPAGEF